MPNLNKLTTSNFRILSRDAAFLDRKIGSRGEVFYDDADKTLRLYDGTTAGGIPLLRADLENIDGVIGAAIGSIPPANVQPGTIWFNTDNGKLYILYNDGNTAQWVQPSTPSVGGGGGGGGATILDELSDVVLTSPTNGQVLKYNGTQWINAAESGGGSISLDGLTDVVISTPSSGQVLKYNGSQWVNGTDDTGVGGSGNSFVNIAVSGQSTVVADSSTDTLTLAAGTNISITTDAASDTITISSTAVSGATNFSSLTDATNASMTVDEFYLPAITSLAVGNVGATSYTFDQYAGNNPTIYAISGTTIAFKINAAGHPFAIQDGFGNLYNTGLIHVSTTGVVSTGLSAQGKDSGTLYWKVPAGISGGYRYQCTAHAPMVGSINVKSFATL